MIRKIIRRFLRAFESHGRVEPVMIYGIKHNGEWLENTRISTSTKIDNIEYLELGDNVFIGHFNFIEASNGLRIAEGCQITNYVSIVTHSSHQSIRLYGKKYRESTNHIGYINGSIEIGKYSFIGPHSLIMPNTKIGKGSFVKAYSMVKGEFPEFSIIAGNPAKVIGSTKEADEKILKNHPELLPNYNEWAKEKK